MRSTTRLMLSGAMIALSLVGCARQAETSASQSAGAIAPERRSATLTVENDNFADMDVFVVPEGGERVRLGMVTGQTTAKFRIDPVYLTGGQVRIVAAPIGGFGAARSGPLLVSGGQTIDFTIGQDLDLSFASVY